MIVVGVPGFTRSHNTFLAIHLHSQILTFTSEVTIQARGGRSMLPGFGSLRRTPISHLQDQDWVSHGQEIAQWYPPRDARCREN